MTVSSTSSGTTSGTTPTSSSSSSTTGASTNLSNIDWTALIQSEVNAMLEPATTIQTSITANEAKITAYQNLQKLLGTLATGSDPLASPDTGSALSTSSIFSARSANVTSSGGSVSPSSVVSMTLDNGAPVGNYTLSVSQLAQAQKVAGTSVASESDALGYSGTFSIGLSGGTTANIAIDSSMSLQDIAANINDQTGTTNVQASIVQISSSQYELVLSGTEDNADIVTSNVSGDDIMTNLGVTDSSGNFTDQIQAAQAATFTFDGIQMTRDTNDVSDVLNGMTFNLLQTTASGTTINIDVEPNTDEIETALQTFVTDYNAVRDFVVTQQATDSDGTASSSAVLFGDGTMNDIMTQLQNAMNTTVNGLSMSDLGLSFTSTNELQLDTSALETTMSSNLSGVEALLASQSTTSSGDLSVVASGDSAPSSFDLDVQVDDSGNVTSASVGGDSSMFSVIGNTIIGENGTSYAGMAFSFSGTSSETVTVTTTHGIASAISGIASTSSSLTSGSLQSLVTNLQSQDTVMQQKVTDIQAQASIYQADLTSRYAQYQASISEATTTLNYLEALLNASSSSS